MDGHSTQLEQSILRTVCWFSLFDYPLSLFEVWKWLLEPDRPYDLAQVARVLEQSPWLQERLDFSEGFYLLKQASTSNACAVRRERFLDASRKFDRLRRACAYFSLLPGVRSVAAVNTLAWWHTTQTSDIDLFIVTRPGSIWSSRFFLVVPFALLGQRPTHDDSRADPFCFSFFVTQDHLQLESLKVASKDHYLAFWLKSMVPMIDKDQQTETVDKLNKWATSVLPHARVRSLHHTHRPKKTATLPLQPKWIDPLFRAIQRRRLPQELVDLANKDTRVVINDTMLKFHENDRRAHFMERYTETVSRHL